jgi:hypothetical protein
MSNVEAVAWLEIPLYAGVDYEEGRDPNQPNQIKLT